MKPLLILKPGALLPREEVLIFKKEVERGLEAGALILSPEVEILAFDELGRLVYPTKEARTRKRKSLVAHTVGVQRAFSRKRYIEM